MLYSLAEIRISRQGCQHLWKGKDISSCAPVKTRDMWASPGSQHWCCRAWSLGLQEWERAQSRQPFQVLQHRVAISKQWHPVKSLLMCGGQAGVGASQSEASMAGETGAAVVWKLGMSRMGQDELLELKGGRERRAAQVKSTCYARVLQCQWVQSTLATEWQR